MACLRLAALAQPGYRRCTEECTKERSDDEYRQGGALTLAPVPVGFNCFAQVGASPCAGTQGRPALRTSMDAAAPDRLCGSVEAAGH